MNSLHLQNEMFLMKVKSMLNTIVNEIKMLNYKKKKKKNLFSFIHTVCGRDGQVERDYRTKDKGQLQIKKRS